MAGQSLLPVGSVPPGHRRPLVARFLTRLFIAAPFLRAIAWRLMPRSRMQRAVIVDLACWLYGRFNETGYVPTEFFSPDVVSHQAPELLDSVGTFHGYEGLAAMVDELRAAWGDMRFEPEEIFEIVDRAGMLAVVRARMVGHGSNVATDRRVAHVVRVRDGAMTSFDVYWEPEDAFRAVRS